MLADIVLVLAVVTAERNQDLLSATLVGAADALRGDERLQRHEKRLREDVLGRLNQGLGDDAFQAAYHQGATLSAREAVALIRDRQMAGHEPTVTRG